MRSWFAGFASVDPDKPAAHGWMVAVRAGGPGSTTLVRRMAVESGRSVPRAARLEATRANEAVIRAVVVFVGRAVRGATPVTTGRRLEVAESAFRGLSPGGAIR